MNKRLSAWGGILSVGLLLLTVGIPAALAGLHGTAGPYRVELTTDPAVIPVGKAKLILKITDSTGKPAEGVQVHALAQMPSMPMGEHEELARRQPSQPDTYAVPAAFAMAGRYTATIKVAGPLGSATATIPLQTGQNTGAVTGGGFSSRRLIVWVVGLLALAFVLYRVRRTGQRPNWKFVFNRSVLAGFLLLAAMLLASNYAIRNLRRKGAMTPVEAQAMAMSTPAPPGAAPVELVTVERGTVESTIRYTGSAVGYVEQDVSPRVSGWIIWMPFYVGDRVRHGQVVARLDTSQVEPQVAERRAALAMAEQEAAVARTEYQQALAAVNEAHAEVGMRKGALEEARANITAAREERAGVEADLTGAETQVADADAQLAAAQADQEYWRAELRRMRALQAEGAVSGEEYQREKAQAENAEAKVRQAQARVTQVQSSVRGAQSRVRKADAMLTAANTKVDQSTSELDAHFAHVRTAQAGIATAQRRIDAAQAGVRQARASLAGATTTRGYAEIRSLVDGVITQRVISPGTLVNPGQTVLKVAQIRPIRLQANVAEADLDRVRVGAPVTVLARGEGSGKPISARVTSIAPAVDPVARTAVVEAVLPNADGRFLPGQYVVMSLSTGRSDRTLHLPATAVRWRTLASGGVLSTRSTPYVWLAEPSGSGDEFTVRPVDIRVGRSDGSATEVLAGLKEGERVVSAGHQDLKSGDTVAAVGSQSARAGETTATSRGGQTYTCPMHPEVVRNRPGKCPKCGMDLVPRKEDHSGMSHEGGMRGSAGAGSRPAAQVIRYTCPMHPEVVQDRPGKCPKCGMDLVRQEGGAR